MQLRSLLESRDHLHNFLLNFFNPHNNPELGMGEDTHLGVQAHVKTKG